MNTSYEWTVEVFAENSDDIVQSEFSDTLKDLVTFTERHDIGVVKDWGDACEYRAWAYIRDGKLQSHFHDAYGKPVSAVPKRFHKELEKFNA